MGYDDRTEFSVLVGKTLKSVDVGSDYVNFETEEGQCYRMAHDQDCCESVTVEDVVGDVKDLIGSPIVQAEETQSGDDPEGYPKREYEADSQTWTFYRLATVKGSVCIRWYGSSNGYYSESVSFEKA